MASGYSESVDSSIDSDWRFRVSDPPYRSPCYGGHRPRTRRRGTYFPRHSKNVIPLSASDYRCSGDETPELERDLNSLSSRNEERTYRPFDKFREKYRYDKHTSSPGNSEDFNCEPRSAERIQIERDRDNNREETLYDKSEITGRESFYSRRGRGARARGRKLFANHSNTEEDPFQLNWREGLTDTSKTFIDALYDCRVWLVLFCRSSELAERKTQ